MRLVDLFRGELESRSLLEILHSISACLFSVGGQRDWFLAKKT